MTHLTQRKDYAAAGNFTAATQVLNAISSKYDLTGEQEDDLDDIASIFSILSARGVDALTQGDIDDLLDLTERPGHASSMARGILWLHGYLRSHA